MRGTRFPLDHERALLGIIPADAGNTMLIAAICAPSPDHPRGCGEHVPDDGGAFGDLGSSPRMRGTLPSQAPCRHHTRIIPADAGNTSVGTRGKRMYRDHPRGCGEHGWSPKPPRPVGGSSPRMRQHDGDRVLGVRIGGSSPRMRGTRG